MAKIEVILPNGSRTKIDSAKFGAANDFFTKKYGAPIQRAAAVDAEAKFDETNKDTTSAGRAAFEGLKQGTSFGFADEMEGASGALYSLVAPDSGVDPSLQDGFTETYSRERDAARDLNRRAELEHQGAHLAGNLAGSTLGMAGAGIAAAPALGRIGLGGAAMVAPRAVTVAEGALRGAAAGGGFGALQGLGNSNADGLGQMAVDTGEGAAFGALSGGVLGGLGGARSMQTPRTPPPRPEPTQSRLADLIQSPRADAAAKWAGRAGGGAIGAGIGSVAGPVGTGIGGAGGAVAGEAAMARGLAAVRNRVAPRAPGRMAPESVLPPEPMPSAATMTPEQMAAVEFSGGRPFLDLDGPTPPAPTQTGLQRMAPLEPSEIIQPPRTPTGAVRAPPSSLPPMKQLGPKSGPDTPGGPRTMPQPPEVPAGPPTAPDGRALPAGRGPPKALPAQSATGQAAAYDDLARQRGPRERGAAIADDVVEGEWIDNTPAPVEFSPSNPLDPKYPGPIDDIFTFDARRRALRDDMESSMRREGKLAPGEEIGRQSPEMDALYQQAMAQERAAAARMGPRQLAATRNPTPAPTSGKPEVPARKVAGRTSMDAEAKRGGPAAQSLDAARSGALDEHVARVKAQFGSRPAQPPVMPTANVDALMARALERVPPAQHAQFQAMARTLPPEMLEQFLRRTLGEM